MFWHRPAPPILHLPGLDLPILRRKVANIVGSHPGLPRLRLQGPVTLIRASYEWRVIRPERGPTLPPTGHIGRMPKGE